MNFTENVLVCNQTFPKGGIKTTYKIPPAMDPEGGPRLLSWQEPRPVFRKENYPQDMEDDEELAGQFHLLYLSLCSRDVIRTFRLEMIY